MAGIFTQPKTLFALILFFLVGCGESENTRKNRFLLKGNVALEEHNEEQAILYFREAIKIDSCFADAYNNLGTVYFRLRKFEDALEAYDHAIACRPGYLNSYFNRANTLYELGKPLFAHVDIQKVLIERPDTVPALFLQGLILTKLREFKRAEDIFKAALKRDSLNVELLVNLGTVHYYQKQYPEAVTYLQKAIGLSPKEANAYNARALVEVATDKLDDALKSINKAIDLKPGNAFYRNNRGYVYLLKDELALALEDIDYSITTDPYNAWAYRNKGIYYLKKGDTTNAIRLLEQAESLDSNVDQLYVYLVDAYMSSKEFVKACAARKKAIERHEKAVSMIVPNCN